MARIIEIGDMVTVGALAETLELPVSQLIMELMKNGVMATVNEKIDFDTASIIVGDLGLEIELKRREKEETMPAREKPKLSKNAKTRPPVVAVMGHVDHGKTSLLDAIRKSSVADKEAGGITQHISAYQIKHGERLITFLDTPGHEAFAALREHGARLTDVAIIVVAADDGIKPQTIEAIRFARKSEAKMIVAITKIDKPGANANMIKQQLAEQKILIEEWGGDTVVVEVSAKTGQNLDKLLDMVLLVADLEELKADYDVAAHGLVIESHMEQGRGPVAIVLVEQGILKRGQFVVAGSAYGKVRLLETTLGEAIESANPSSPALVSGFKVLPEFGDNFVVVSSEKEARNQALAASKNNSGASGTNMTSSELIRIINKRTKVDELNIIIKADVQGSLTSVIDSLKTLDTDEVAVKIVGQGVGAISESDIHMAHSAGAVIYGFSVDSSPSVKRIAQRDEVELKIFKVIYELIDDVKSRLSGMLAPEVTETKLGKLEVKGVFKILKNEVICGGEVKSGKITLPASVQVMRGDELIGEGELAGMQKGKEDVKELVEGDVCGLRINTKQRLVVEVGDKLEFIRREEIVRSL